MILKLILYNSKNDWIALERRVRSVTKDVVPCNVLKDPIMPEHPSQPFDVVITTICIEEASKDYASFKTNLKKLVGVLKPGGHFLIATMIELSHYYVQNQLIKTLSVTEEQVKEAISNAGLEIIKAILYTKVDSSNKEDSTGVSFIFALKK